MKVAIPYWQGRVSPVLDVAGRFLLVDLDEGREVSRQDGSLAGADPLARSRQLQQVGTQVLICGAVSRELALGLDAAGVQVIPHICGQVEEVLAAFIGGQLDQDAFLMPGCCGQRRRFQLGRRHGGRCGITDRKAVATMPRGDGTGPASGGGRRRGMKGEPSAVGVGGQCICPKCGQKVPHVAGQPCNQQACPKCGATMTRG